MPRGANSDPREFEDIELSKIRPEILVAFTHFPFFDFFFLSLFASPPLSFRPGGTFCPFF